MWLLPEYSAECYADPAAIACDYPEDVLLKVASAKLEEKAPDVLAFLETSPSPPKTSSRCCRR